MFDRVIVNPQRGPTDQYVTVTERRAPTDESVRLLQEMEAAVTERVIARYGLQNSMIDAEWIAMKVPQRREVRVLCRVKLREKEFRAERMLDETSLKMERTSSVPTVLLEMLTDALASGLYYHTGVMGFRCLYTVLGGKTNG
jgi:hypothetical protein